MTDTTGPRDAACHACGRTWDGTDHNPDCVLERIADALDEYVATGGYKTRTGDFEWATIVLRVVREHGPGIDAHVLTEVARLREALTSLLDEPPVFRDYTGTDEDTCGYCHTALEGYEGRVKGGHSPTCPWAIARRALHTDATD